MAQLFGVKSEELQPIQFELDTLRVSGDPFSV